MKSLNCLKSIRGRMARRGRQRRLSLERLERRAMLAVSVVNNTNGADLVAQILGTNVAVTNIQFSGYAGTATTKAHSVNAPGGSSSAGTFTGGDGILGFDSGIILSTGGVHNVVGPNIYDSATKSLSQLISQNNNRAGDASASMLSGGQTQDATVLEFDFVPDFSSVSFQYVFASDEYNEYTNANLNDVFGFFVNGVNIATLPSTSTASSVVSINNVNSVHNASFYRNNGIAVGKPIDIEMDGLTTVLAAASTVNAGQVNHIKLVIADVSDRLGDSNVFIKAASFGSNSGPSIAADNAVLSVIEGQSATRSGSYVDPNNLQTVTLSASVGTITKTGTSSGTWEWNYSTNDGPLQSQSVTITADDGNGGINSFSFPLVVNNANPMVTSLTASPSSLLEGQSTTLSGTISDLGVNDSHTVVIDWMDGSAPTTLSLAAGVSTFSSSHTFIDGVGTPIFVSVTDNDNGVGTAAITINVTAVNDAPVISANAISIAEGAPLVLGSGNINTTDPDNTPTQLTYSATSVTGGRFELVAAPGTAITSFTQAQINSGAVRFVHNGGEVAPSYSLTVSDGALSSAASTGSVTFTNVNDAPVISANAISIAEGATLVLGSGNINTTDPDNSPTQLTYSATSVTGGRFELVAAPGTAITSFTQAQINSGAVRFVHNGGEVAPSYSLTVSDGALSSAASPAAVTFTNVNDAPVISANAISIAEGATVVLGSGNINTTDPDNTPTQLIYTATSVTGGRFELVAAPGTAITSFTQAQINSGAVRFVHNSSEVAPSYSLTVSDGALSSAASTGGVTFTNVNDAPVISANAISIAEGATLVFGSGNINTTDPDNSPTQLTYSATSVTGGRFELVTAPGTAITSFTQAQINSGAVRFVHNGGEVAPSYSLTVSDGALSSAASPAAVTFTSVNDAPVISANAISIAEGATLVLGSGNINTTDADNTPAQLIYSATSVTGGRFELVAAPGTAITSFTQAQINAGAVRFVHNGGEVAPSYSLTVSDGALSSAASPAAVTFTSVNDAPVISANAISIAEGATLVLGSVNINTTDPDNTPAQLIYTATSVTGGRFELVAAPGTAITSFTQAQINAGAVRFVHNGGEVAPSYSLTVSDGALSSAASAAAVTFTSVNDAPVISANAISIAEGATLILGSGNINTTDPDNTPTQLTYSATSVTGGRFELVAAPGVAITSFTQAQINAGAVRFVHNSGEVAPSYSLTVSDGALSSAASPAAVTFTSVNDAPVISANAISITEGATLVLGSGNINTTDPDNTPTQLTYSATSVTGGRFEFVAAPGTAITSFTQAQINSGAVRFVHNGNETAPAYSLTVTDGALSSATSSPAVTFTNVNDAPQIAINTLSITEGGSVVLSSSNINAVDPDNSPSQLTYTLSNVSGGRFERVTNPGTAVTTFTQADINSGAIRFVHDNSENAPSFTLVLSDGTSTTPGQTNSGGTFTNVNDNYPVFTSNSSRSIAENGTLVGNVTATDADLPIQTITYAITGGADATKFTITSAGALSFVSAPDFESPTDVGGNNIYDLQVLASDGSGLLTVQNLSVTVTDVVETLTPGVTLQNGVLRIIGTNGADVVGVSELWGTLRLAMYPPVSVQSFRAIDVTRIEIFLQGGHDKATIGPAINRPVLIDGGDDNDNLTAGLGDATIYGGNGNDTITGGSARNWIDAGSGDDIVYGSVGDDTLFGGEGNDLLYGAGGKDVIDGGAHDDIIYGGQGDDLIRGGSGNDRLYGEDGNDVLLGNEGVDYLYGGYGRDLLIGGTGADVLSGEFDDDLLIGGATTFDNSDTVLLALLAEWNSSRTYDQRVANLRGTGSGTRLNGSSFLTNATVTDDSAVDLLYGNQGRDWFWAITGQDQINDKSTDENSN